MKKTQLKKYDVKALSPFLALIIAYLGLIVMSFYVCILNNKVSDMQEQIKNSRTVLFYNLDAVLRATDAVNAKTQFEGEIIKLNDEVFAAEEKIKSIKDAKVKADFSDVYLNNLKMKRDDLVKKYEQNVKALTDKINNALADVAKENNAAAIFVQNALAVNTPETHDVTDEIIAKIQAK